MIATAQMTDNSMYIQDENINAVVTPVATRSATMWGVALAELAIGYEWLISGLNKLFSGTFTSGLAHTLQTSLDGNPNAWYGNLVKALVLPHPGLFGGLVVSGEVLVGLGMFMGAALWFLGRRLSARWMHLLHLLTAVALVGGVLMSLNYALLGGDTLPWINASNPFNEGISIDSLLAMIGLGLLAAHIIAMRHSGQQGYDRTAKHHQECA